MRRTANIAQLRQRLLSLVFGLFLALSGQAQQVDFDLEVDVVMDTVLYGGFVGADEVVPDGFRRYRLYAIFPDDAEIMLGPVADDSSDPAIPGFGYSSDCGCFNSFGLGGILDFDTGAEVNSAFYTPFPEVQYDTWWTTHVSQVTPGTNVIEPASTFPIGYNSCSDLVVQGGLLATNADPIHASVTDGRALIGQITTCESFSFQVCVAFQNGVGTPVTTSCTDGFVEVSDLCAPLIDPQGQVMEEVDAPGGGPSIEIIPNDPFVAFPSTVEYTLWEIAGGDTALVGQQVGNHVFSGVSVGTYFVSIVDLAQDAAWSSNTCRDTTGTLNIVPQIIPGCTFPGALNYQPFSNLDDGSCLIEGCMEEAALNYDANANIPAVCIPSPEGCTWNAETEVWDCGEICPADLNADGVVSIPDLLILLGGFATGCED